MTSIERNYARSSKSENPAQHVCVCVCRRFLVMVRGGGWLAAGLGARRPRAAIVPRLIASRFSRRGARRPCVEWRSRARLGLPRGARVCCAPRELPRVECGGRERRQESARRPTATPSVEQRLEGRGDSWRMSWRQPTKILDAPFYKKYCDRRAGSGRAGPPRRRARARAARAALGTAHTTVHAAARRAGWRSQPQPWPQPSQSSRIV